MQAAATEGALPTAEVGDIWVAAAVDGVTFLAVGKVMLMTAVEGGATLFLAEDVGSTPTVGGVTLQAVAMSGATLQAPAVGGATPQEEAEMAVVRGGAVGLRKNNCRSYGAGARLNCLA